MSAERIAFLRGLVTPALLFTVPLVITVVASMSSSPGIRSVRNIGIAACYLGLVFGLLRLGWRQTLLVWTALGILSGVAYFAYECFSHARANDPSAARPSPSTVLHGILAWPIMTPEAVEYFLADIGVLKAAAPAAPAQGMATEGTSPPARGGSE